MCVERLNYTCGQATCPNIKLNVPKSQIYVCPKIELHKWLSNVTKKSVQKCVVKSKTKSYTNYT
jgi:hypothetical protein